MVYETGYIHHPPAGAATSIAVAPVRSAGLAAVGLALLRVALGVVFVAHALLKLLVFGLPGVAQFFVAHGYPGWSVYPVFALQLLGGIMLIAGLHSRWVALALVPVMTGALLVHIPNGWRFDVAGGGWEYVAFLIVALLAQAAVGDGAYAARNLRRT